jgi:hypothetical protein
LGCSADGRICAGRGHRQALGGKACSIRSGREFNFCRLDTRTRRMPVSPMLSAVRAPTGAPHPEHRTKTNFVPFNSTFSVSNTLRLQCGQCDKVFSHRRIGEYRGRRSARSPLSYAMATFIYCCPNTSLNVESPLADGPNQGRSEIYETLAHSTSNLLAMSMTLIDRMDIVRHKITRRGALAGLFDAAAVRSAGADRTGEYGSRGARRADG